jgi:hypothetical protein
LVKEGGPIIVKNPQENFKFSIRPISLGMEKIIGECLQVVGIGEIIILKLK